MKPKVAKLWIEALESGDYRQIDGFLKSPKGTKSYGYCCLGVLCDVYAKETGKGEWEGSRGSKSFLGVDCELPNAVQVWAGMKSNCGNLPTPVVIKDESGDKIHRDLICLNDDAKYTFKQIAKVVKQHAKDL